MVPAALPSRRGAGAATRQFCLNCSQRTNTGAPRRVPIAAALTCVLMASCTATPLGPSETGALRLRGEVTQGVLPGGGEGHTVSFRLENTGSRTVLLTFPTNCTIRPYVTRRGTSEIVYPLGGNHQCRLVTTPRELRPGDALTTIVHLSVGPVGAFSSAVVVPQGDYSAVATVEAPPVTLISESVSFTVR
jgi:hypothetical protein